MKVLSLFDGISCGRVALKRAGIPVEKYCAAEINKYAVKVAMHNYPDTIQLGDVRDVHITEHFDLLIGGSPCQGFSMAGTGLNFEHPESKLFFEYVRILKECRAVNPNILFLLENVRMKAEHELIISQYLDCRPIVINSALVSAQNRVRLYWTNINSQPFGLFGEQAAYIPQPKDKKIFLKDILEPEVDEKYYLSETALKRLMRKEYSEPKINPGKAGTLNKKNNSGQLSADSGTTLIVHNGQPRSGDPKKGGTGPLSRNDGKTYCISTNKESNLLQIGSLYENNAQGGRVYSANGKSATINSHSGGLGAKTGLYQIHQQDRVNDVNGKAGALPAGTHGSAKHHTKTQLNNSRIRRLTPLECCRLQTVPENYFWDNDKALISDTRIYECLGNGWTVDVIAHILKFINH